MREQGVGQLRTRKYTQGIGEEDRSVKGRGSRDQEVLVGGNEQRACA